MATCTSCGAELTGEFCSQCDAPATGALRRRGMNPALKWVLISFGSLVGVMFLAAIIFPLIMCPGGLFCGDWGFEAAWLAERETMKTAIMSMMVDNDLSQVTASVSGHGGEKIRNTGTQFHDTIVLRDYMDQAATQFCYRWDADGRITFQYDVDDNDDCAIDTEQLLP